MKTRKKNSGRYPAENTYVYYVTKTFQEYRNILKNGVTCSSEGFINLVAGKHHCAYVAINLLKCPESYGVIKVNIKGLEDIMEPYEETGNTPWLLRVEQEKIAPEFIKPVNLFFIDWEEVNLWRGNMSSEVQLSELR